MCFITHTHIYILIYIWSFFKQWGYPQIIPVIVDPQKGIETHSDDWESHMTSAQAEDIFHAGHEAVHVTRCRELPELPWPLV